MLAALTDSILTTLKVLSGVVHLITWRMRLLRDPG